MTARHEQLVWAGALVVLALYVLVSSGTRTTHGFVAYYTAARLLVDGELGPLVYDDAWFTRVVQVSTGTDVLEVFGRSPNAYKATIAIRALDAETGEIDWSGKALSVDRFPDLAQGIHALTCNALATGWGLRKPGMTVETTVCPQGHNVMVLNDPSSPSQNIVKSPPTQLGAHRSE